MRNDERQQHADDETAAFAEHRQTLFSIAYRMLGSVSDTDDILQEVWLSWASTDRTDIENPRAYLIRITVNESLRLLGRAHRRRESYVGPWLPEPLVSEEPDEPDPVVRAEEVSFALLVVLETLGPLERAVFILRETFGYDYAEIGRVLGRTPAAVRQLAHRAREHVQARRPRFEPEPETQRAATERFIAAAMGGDVEALLGVLAPDVTLWTDSGGVVRAARRVVSGDDKVARLFAGLVHKDLMPEGSLREVLVNGEPGILMHSGNTPIGIALIELAPDRERVQSVYVILNPEKLQHVTP